MNLIIRDAKAIGKALAKFAKTAAQYRIEAHLLAVSTLVHANVHGQIAPLNAFVGMLTINEVTALRNYVSRFSYTTNKSGEKVATSLAFLKFKSGEFRIDTDTPTENRCKGSDFDIYAESTLINGKPFLEADNVADLQKIGDDKVVTALKALSKSANGEKENVVSSVTDPLKVLLAKAVREASLIQAANAGREQMQMGTVQ